jgi:phosphoribosylglycinamide formyltransferase 1
MKPRVAIVIGKRGRGSNMAALVRAMQNGQVAAEPALVVSPSEMAPGLQTATDLEVPTQVFETLDQLDETFESIDFICLAGFMSLFPAEILAKFPNRVLNIHPALLPKFGGKGMYGMHVHQAVIESGETESGCTVHYVSDQYDEGAIILQLRCPVLQGDTAEELAARVLCLEHQAYPAALNVAIKNLENQRDL